MEFGKGQLAINKYAELFAPSLILLWPSQYQVVPFQFACLKNLHIGITLSFHLSQKLLIIIFIEENNILNGQPRKGKCTIMEIMKLTIKEDFHRGTC